MLTGFPPAVKAIIVIALLGIFQLFIIMLSKQNEGLFGTLQRSLR